VTLGELLALAVAAVEAESIDYMVTGSLASSLYGEPRSTNDVDIVIDPSPAKLDALVGRLREAGLYVDLEAALHALRERTQFNAIVEDAKVDFILRKGDPFSTSAIQRRRRIRGPAIDAQVMSAEDLVIQKLLWARETGSDRQVRDVAGIVALSDVLDRAYIERWVRRLGLLDAWRAIVAEESGAG
jgi:hypothetical protein